MQTKNNYSKIGETNLMPSKTIQGCAIDINEVMEYVLNDEPIPARFLAKRQVYDVDRDGILDNDVRMIDKLDEHFELTQQSYELLQKNNSKVIDEARKRIKEHDKLVKESREIDQERYKEKENKDSE